MLSAKLDFHTIQFFYIYSQKSRKNDAIQLKKSKPVFFVPPFVSNYSKKPYICNKFFMVLDLRLIRKD